MGVGSVEGIVSFILIVVYLRISFSVSLSVVKQSPACKMVYSGVVVCSMEGSDGSVDMADPLRISFSFSLSKMVVRPETLYSQVVGSSSQVSMVHRSDRSTWVVDKLTQGSGRQAGKE